MRPAIWLALAALAACGQRDPTIAAVYAPAAHETRAGAIAEQRDAAKVEERASRSRTEIGTEALRNRTRIGPESRIGPRIGTEIRPESRSPHPISYGGWATAQASWYGPGFYGHRTACGQTYTPTIVGVAHRTLPCGTLVTLEHNGATVTAPVIDRGPYVAGRTFDLSQALCRRLGHCFTGPIRYRY